jgi:hypothetical protein
MFSVKIWKTVYRVCNDLMILSVSVDVNEGDKERKLNSEKHTCAGEQTFPQPVMEIFVKERFVQHFGVCQQYLRTHKERKK